MSPEALRRARINTDGEDDDDLTPAAFREEIRRIEHEEKREVDEDDDDLTPGAFKAAIAKTKKEDSSSSSFDGYGLASLLQSKWGAELDVDFRPVTSLSNTGIYICIMPIPLGSRRCRHKSREDYMMHLQGVVEVLEKYDELDAFVEFVTTTNKVPRANTSPLIAVTYRLDLTEEQVGAITNG